MKTPDWLINRKAANKVLAWLREQLGEKCATCGADSSSRVLEFDCIEPQGDKHHRWETNRRAYFYRKQYRAGNLQLLCQPCHWKKSGSERYWQETLALEAAGMVDDSQPF